MKILHRRENIFTNCSYRFQAEQVQQSRRVLKRLEVSKLKRFYHIKYFKRTILDSKIQFRHTVRFKKGTSKCRKTIRRLIFRKRLRNFFGIDYYFRRRRRVFFNRNLTLTSHVVYSKWVGTRSSTYTVRTTRHVDQRRRSRIKDEVVSEQNIRVHTHLTRPWNTIVRVIIIAVTCQSSV